MRFAAAHRETCWPNGVGVVSNLFGCGPGPHVSVPCQPSTSDVFAGHEAGRALGAVAAVSCIDREQTSDDGQWTVQVRRVSSSGIAEFLSAIDRGDEQPTSGVCTANLVSNPVIAVVSPSGRYVFPRFPLDSCGKPMQGLADRITNWQEVSTLRVRQQYTAAELDGHCEPAWKNLLAMDLDPHPSAGGRVLAQAPTGVPLHACIYQTGADHQIGQFEKGITVAASDADRLRADLAAPGSTDHCPPQSSFAVVQAVDHGEVTVELGGCWRVLRDDLDHGGTGKANPTIVQGLLD